MIEPNLRMQRPSPDCDRDAKLRAGDRDRDAVAENLRTQHAEGRLDTDELQERIGRCYDAKTLGELEHLVVDLPRRSAGDERWAWGPAPWRMRLIAPIPIAIALSAVTGRHVIWLTVPLMFLTTRLARLRHGPSWASRPRALGRPSGMSSPNHHS